MNLIKQYKDISQDMKFCSIIWSDEQTMGKIQFYIFTALK